MPLAWLSRSAPSLDDFEHMAREAFRTLPQEVRDLTGEIAFRVADFADDDVLDALDVEDPFDVLGLFEGTGLAQRGATLWTGQMGNRIWLYRRPILDYWAEHDETLETIIAHVLVHEIGHHFGLSDDDMERIERAAE